MSSIGTQKSKDEIIFSLAPTKFPNLLHLQSAEDSGRSAIISIQNQGVLLLHEEEAKPRCGDIGIGIGKC